MKKLINYLCLLGIVGIVLMYVFMLSSCESNSSGKRYGGSITWRARSIKQHKLIIVENKDSLPIRSGDTVVVMNSDAHPFQFYIVNLPSSLADSVYLDVYIDGEDTVNCKWNTYNVVLTQRIEK